jgi:hypothetical protein
MVFGIRALRPNFPPQKDDPDAARKEKIRLKFMKALAKRYFKYGDVASLT